MCAFSNRGNFCLAQHAIPPVLQHERDSPIITGMTLLRIIAGTISEWARAILVDILGHHLEEIMNRCVKRWRDKKPTNTDVPESK
jgi:hypothetical protein